LAGCGSSQDAIPPVVAPAQVEPPAAPQPERPAPGTLWRDEVIATLDQGLGAFLANRVELRAKVLHGEFRGFEIVTLRGADYWGDLDLRPGDIVQAINGMPIERETEAFDAFESLRQADALRVDFLRDGRPRQLSLRIVERPSAAQAKPVAAPASAASGDAVAPNSPVPAVPPPASSSLDKPR